MDNPNPTLIVTEGLVKKNPVKNFREIPLEKVSF